jgi:hypothetical protein
MPLLRKRRVLAAKIEATPGDAETLAAADGAFNVFDPQINPSIEFAERPGQGVFSPLPGTLGARGGQITFTTEIYSGATTPPWASTLLPACGFIETTGVFAPVSKPPGPDGVKTLTLGLYEDGRLKVLRGCMGTFVITFPAGRKPTIAWTYTGLWVDPTDATLIAPTYPTESPLRFASAALTIGGVTPKIEQMTIDAGNTVVLREDANDASGYATALVTDRRIVGSINPEAQKISADDVYGDWLSRAQKALAMTLGGDNNQIKFAAPKLQFTNVQDADRNGMIVDQIDFQLCRDDAAGDDELTIDFSPAAE